MTWAGVGPSGYALRFFTGNDVGATEWVDPYPLIVVSAGATVVLNGTNEKVIVRKTIGSHTQILVPADFAIGQVITIKDGKGDAAVNNIDVVPSSGTIDGNVRVTLANNYQSLSIAWDGTVWSII